MRVSKRIKKKLVNTNKRKLPSTPLFTLTHFELLNLLRGFFMSIFFWLSLNMLSKVSYLSLKHAYGMLIFQL